MRKFLLLTTLLSITAIFIWGCSKNEDNTSLTSNNERRPDPLETGASVTYVQPTNWHIQWDTTLDCGTVFLNWDDQNVDRYYILFEGIGNGSCSKTITVNGITYFYPWTYTNTNARALHIGTICNTTPNTTYNIIILYYKFKKGEWYGYTSIPITIQFNRAYYQCPF